MTPTRRRTWRSLTWEVDQYKHVERYKYVRRKGAACKKRKDKKRSASGKRKRCKGRRDVKYQRPRRVLRAKPFYWTNYRARARLGSLSFYIERSGPSKSYTAHVSLDETCGYLAQASGATAAKAYNAALDVAEKRLKKLKVDVTKILKLLYEAKQR